MSPAGTAPPEMATGNLRMSVGGLVIQARITAPTAPVKQQAVLPALQGLVNAVVSASEQELAGAGKTVSCKAGCGACCRQAVPISVPEAYFIQELVEQMPEPRRSAIKARFAEAGQRLRDAGLHDAAMRIGEMGVEARQVFDQAYFRLAIACPFLEDESCSIHPDRPLACREYLVTSPPTRCASPHEGGINVVPVPKLSTLLRFSGGESGEYPAAVSLSVALAWADRHPDTLPLRPGTQWVQDFLGRMARPPAQQAAAQPSPPATAASPGQDGSVVAGVRLPSGKVRAEALLPVLQRLADEAARTVTAQAEAIGDAIACRAGCGACCRQIIPVSAIEARRLAALVDGMPEPRRSTIRKRFAAAEQRLSAWERLGELDTLLAEGRGDPRLAIDYMRLKLACPFLEDESCSIYHDRPLICREYLVTSDPKFCFALDDELARVKRVPSARLATALDHLSADDGPRRARTDMIRMLSWVAAHPETSAELPAALWLERFATRLREAQAAAEARGGRVPEIAALVPLGGRGAHRDDSRPDAASQVEVAIPPGMVSAADMLPTFGAFANAMVQDVIAASAAKGKPISCRAGCTACCHELLIVSSLEARRIATLVEDMPEPRRSEVRARFAEAERRIAGWDRAAEFEQGLAQGAWKDGDLPAAWFGLKIPCPLLEGGSCSIYEERPLVCREHMVTSPAENCARSDDPSVQIDVLPSALTYLALRHLAPLSSAGENQGIPLVRALRWAATHPAPPGPLLPAQIWLNRFFDRLHNVKRYGYAVESIVEDTSAAESG